MCTPSALIGGALSVGGAISSAQASKKAAKANQRAIDNQTALSKAEFDRRYKLIGESDERIGAISREGFEETEALDAQARREGLRSEAEGFDELLNIDSDAADRGFAKRLGAYEDLTDLGRERDAGISASEARLRGYSDAEAQRQRGFQDRADSETASLLQGLSRAGMDPRQERARQEAISLGVSEITSPLQAAPQYAAIQQGPADVRKSVNDAVYDSVLEQRQGAINDATAGSFDEALRLADRDVAGAEGTLAGVEAQADSSFSALEPELEAGRLVRTNAEAKRDSERESALADVESFLDNLQVERNMRRGVASTVRGRKDAARNDHFSRAGDAKRNFFSSRLGAERNFAGALNANSANFEDTNRSLTQFKVNNTRTSDPLGQILSSAGGSLMSASVPKVASWIDSKI